MLFSVLFLLACSPSVKSGDEQSIHAKDSSEMYAAYGIQKAGIDSIGTWDTLLPFFAKLHDSIPYKKRFDSVYSAFMKVHKKERKYQWLFYAKKVDSFDYFMISRLEPSIKSDKYSALCARFKRLSDGRIDTSSFEELFWTWKMLLPELKRKSAVLFKERLKSDDMKAYLPENSEEEYIMFPDIHTRYDKRSKSWMTVQAR